MATKPVAKSPLSLPGCLVYIWEGLAGADVGAVVKLPGYRDLTVQMGASGGTTDGGATTVMQGTNDPQADVDPSTAEWFTLTEEDTASTAVSTTTASIIKRIKEKPLFIRPSQSGGAAGDWDVILTVR